MIIRVYISIPQMNITNLEKKVPGDTPLVETINKLAMSLHETLQNRQEYTHDMFLRRGDKNTKLDPDRSLDAQGVKDGDCLEFVVDKIVAAWREDRLANEHKKIVEKFMLHPVIAVRPLKGNPPVEYEVTYTLRGFAGRPPKGNNAMPPMAEKHVLRVNLDPRMYPNKGPDLIMQTTTFHPNISREGKVCVGQYPDGKWDLSLWVWKDAIIQTGRMIMYHLWNNDNSFDSEARDFIKQNQHKGVFPLDNRRLDDGDM